MPIHRTFIFQEDDDTGLMGLKPDWIRNANAFQGVAHDVLEHFPLNERLNVVEDEMQALGAVLALRIASGQFSHLLTNANHVSNLVYGVLSDMSSYGLERPRFKSTRPLQDDQDWAEKAIQEGVGQAIVMMRSEMQDELDFADEDERSEAEEGLARLKDSLISHLRTGFRRAQRRYAKADIYTVGSYLFNKLDKLSKSICESECLGEGDKVSFSVDTHRCHVSARINGLSLDYYGL